MILEKCPTSEELRAFSLGQLNEEQSDEMLGHVQKCGECQADLETDAGEDTLIKSLRSEDPDAFAEESDCQVAMAKALGALAASEALDNSELSQLLPKVLGDYEIVRSLGRGGMGNVYLARHQKLGREVALKVLSSHRLLQPRMRQRFETEMRAVGRLSHPNIVTAYDAREVDDLAVLVTEYIEGLDVGQVLRRTGKLSVADACEIARQTADAMGYVNEQGLVHRDIKPSNVMLSRGGEVKLLDLGLARLRIGDDESPEMTATGQAMGTADYIAPEQVSDSRNVDIRADIYALGCTLFKMLSGRAPFGTNQYPTSFAKMTAHVSDAPPRLQEVAPDVPRELATLVDQMIAKNPADRPQSPEEIAKRLTRFSKSAALSQLAEDALNRGVVADLSVTRDARIPVGRPVSQSFFTRRVPMFAAIGAGLLGALLGVVLGIVITVKQPDGTENSVKLPNGADAEIAANGDISVKVPGDARGGADNSYSVEGTVVDENGNRLNPEDLKPLPVPTKESLSGIWRTVSWGHEAQVAASAAASALYVFHDDKMFPVIDSQFMQDPMPYSIESENTFAVLTFSPGNGNPSPEMKVMMQFVGPDRIQMTTAGGPATILERMATLPVTPETLKRIKETKDTILFADAVEEIDAFCRTGKLPGQTAALKDKAMREMNSVYMRMISLAVLNHESATQRFPASANQRRLTKPVSWRVKILPFLGNKERKLFEAYRLDEEWDSEHNLKLLERMPQAYRGGYAPGSTKTNFLAVAGEDTIIGDRPIKIGDVGDLQKTILFVHADKSVPWTKPDDLTADEVLELAKRAKGVHAAFADGAVRFLEGPLAEPENLTELMSAISGEQAKVEPDEDEFGDYGNRSNPKDLPVDPLATQERLQGIWRAVSWDNEAQEHFDSSVPLMVFDGDKFFTVLGTDFQDAMPFQIEPERTFSLLTFSNNDVEMKANVRFVDANRFEIETPGTTPKTIFKRLAKIPVSTSELNDIKLDRDLAPLADTVAEIDAFVRNGKMPKRKRRRWSKNQLRQLGLGLLNFESAQGFVPSSAKNDFDKQSNIEVSWRVKILPFIDQADLHKQYRTDEPWGSKNNLKVLEKMPDAFRQASDPKGTFTTRFLAVAGRETVVGDNRTGIGQIHDGTGNTIMLVEAERAVPWTKPDDIGPDELINWIQSKSVKGMNAVFADCGTRFLEGEAIEPKNLRALISRAGGEALDVDRGYFNVTGEPDPGPYGGYAEEGELFNQEGIESEAAVEDDLFAPPGASSE